MSTVTDVRAFGQSDYDEFMDILEGYVIPETPSDEFVKSWFEKDLKEHHDWWTFYSSRQAEFLEFMTAYIERTREHVSAVEGCEGLGTSVGSKFHFSLYVARRVHLAVARVADQDLNTEEIEERIELNREIIFHDERELG